MSLGAAVAFLVALALGFESLGTKERRTEREAVLKLAADYWEGTLRANPRWATQLGDRRFDDRLEDYSPEGKAQENARIEGVLAQAKKVDASKLDAKDRLTLRALVLKLENDLDGLSCKFEEWNLDPMGGPQVDLMNLPPLQPVKTPEQGRAMVARWHAIGPFLDVFCANIRRGLSSGKVATRDAATKVLVELDDLLAKPALEWPLALPGKETHDDWPESERRTFREALLAAVSDSANPAFERMRALVRDEVLPRARPQEKPGLCHIEGGREAYRKLIRIHTSLDLSPQEIHETGLAEIARIKGEMEALGKKLFGTKDLALLRARLSTDKAMFFSTRDEVEKKANEALRRAEAAVPRVFRLLPRTPCVVKRLEPHEEKFSTIAYYREPAADGSRPGTYYINTYAPETRPRYEAEALAFHEAVPGHHLQIAIAQELTGLPEFRKHTGITAYVEGWALYTERLADELGLYEGDQDRLGMLSYEAWRASRLVVDTGMHSLGWTRQRAIDYMLANTLLAENNITNEVDRYIVWPGQALAYKTGQLEILRLRDEAKKRLGERFDLRDFHDRVLEVGAVSLPLLRERIAAWLDSR